MRYLASSIFSSPPPNPRINEILRQTAPPPPPLPPPRKSPALKSVHRRTKYHKPIPPDGGVIAADEHERKVVVGESGVSYLLPGAPFEFQFSYSETPKAKPLAIREPAFLPFAPPSMPRPWTGKAPLKSKKEKDLKKQRNVRLLNPADSSETEEIPPKTVFKMSRSVPGLVQSSSETRSRGKILGKPLTKSEIKALLKPHLSDNRQINLGRDGLTHNMLELVHTHWRRSEVCKVRCRGVPTVDMNNVCRHLEEKTGGKIIHRAGGVVYLFRGRNYDPRTRPRFPVMLWKPATPVYPKLIQEVPEGLTREETIEFRKKGETLPPICKLAKNGIYITLVRNVRDAFEGSPLVKIDCRGLHPSDFKKIGAKLKELVPCVLLSFDNDQILMWRGRDWKSKYLKPTLLDSSSTVFPSKRVEEGKTVKLWRQALESGTAMLLPEVDMCPDSLRYQVELFEASSLAADHSFPAIVSENSASDSTDEDSSSIDYNDDDDGDDRSLDLFEASSQAVDHSFPALISESSVSDEDSTVIDDNDDDDDDDDEGSLDLMESTVPYGSLGVDMLARSLRLD